MKISLIEGRLGNHRFHSMLIHFPAALYPFSFIMDGLGFLLSDNSFTIAAWYSMAGALGASILAIVYGAVDFLLLKGGTPVWKKAGLHALLNTIWFLVFSFLFLLRMKYPEEPTSWIYLTIMGTVVAGLFYSNYLGADLIIKNKVGIEPEPTPQE